MKVRLVLCALFFLGFHTVPLHAKIPDWLDQQLNKPYSQIDESAEAILLYSSVIIICRKDSIITENKVLYQLKKTGGLDFGSLLVFSDEQSVVASVEGWRFGKDKELVEKLKRKDINRIGYSENFHDDSQVVTATFKNVALDDYVAFEYATRRPVFSKDMIIPMGGFVEIKNKMVTVPESATTQILNDPHKLIKKTDNTYILEEQPALKDEPNAQDIRSRIPYLAISFDRQNHEDWSAFSHFYWSLAKDALLLDEETKEDFFSVFKEPDTCSFITKTVKKVTDTINYVAIELGKGGYIPRNCNTIHQKKYGDCKDMAFYATALLREKGIKAWPALTRTRSAGPIFPEFPSHQFNHVVVLIELNQQCEKLKNLEYSGKAYLLADPTDRFTPLPLYGSHLENVFVLPIKESGASLIPVPLSNAALHKTDYDITFEILADQSANIKVIETKSGHHAADEKIYRENLKKVEEKESYQSWIQTLLPGSMLLSHSIESNDDVVATTLTFTAKNVGLTVQNQLYILPNLIDNRNKGFHKRTRTSGIDFGYLSSSTVTITLLVDQDYSILEIPKESGERNDFFSYTFSVNQRDHIISLTKKIEWLQTIIPEDQYPSFRKSYKKYLKTVKAPVIVTL